MGVEEKKFEPQKDSESGQFGAKCGILIRVNVKYGMLSTIGCHFPPKSTKLGRSNLVLGGGGSTLEGRETPQMHKYKLTALVP